MENTFKIATAISEELGITFEQHDKGLTRGNCFLDSTLQGSQGVVRQESISNDYRIRIELGDERMRMTTTVTYVNDGEEALKRAKRFAGTFKKARTAYLENNAGRLS